MIHLTIDNKDVLSIYQSKRWKNRKDETKQNTLDLTLTDEGFAKLMQQSNWYEKKCPPFFFNGKDKQPASTFEHKKILNRWDGDDHISEVDWSNVTLTDDGSYKQKNRPIR